MMEVVIITQNEKVRNAFNPLSKTKGVTLRTLQPAELKASLKNFVPGSLVYLDISSIPETDRGKTIKLLQKQSSIIYAIIDPAGSHGDPALFFHEGASDYIGKELVKKGLEGTRLRRILSFRSPELPPEKINNTSTPFIPSGSNWDQVKEGKEYTFCFMLVELDNHREMKKKMGAKLLSAMEEKFQSLIERHAAHAEGRIWMWDDFRGLILFPFDGKSCDAVLICFRLMLNWRLILLEDLRFNTSLSCRIVLHIGNTQYRLRGDTGTIISDTINTIFHMGDHFTRPGTLYLTEDVGPFIPRGLADCFVHEGVHENKKVMRLKGPDRP